MKINKKELIVGNTAYISLFIGTKNMHLGHLKEKAGYMITFLEKQKIQKIV